MSLGMAELILNRTFVMLDRTIVMSGGVRVSVDFMLDWICVIWDVIPDQMLVSLDLDLCFGTGV